MHFIFIYQRNGKEITKAKRNKDKEREIPDVIEALLKEARKRSTSRRSRSSTCSGTNPENQRELKGLNAGIRRKGKAHEKQQIEINEELTTECRTLKTGKYRALEEASRQSE
jgi:hypothetical protein